MSSKREKKLKTVTRVMVSILVLFLIVSMVAPAFAADDKLVVVSADNIEVTGDPAPSWYREMGIYTFKIEFIAGNGTLQMITPYGEKSKIKENITTESITYGGLTFKKPPKLENDGWIDGYTFRVEIGSYSDGGGVKPFATIEGDFKSTSGSTLTSIRRNQQLNGSFTVVDPENKHSDIKDNSMGALINNCPSFTNGDSINVTKSKTPHSSGSATFDVEINRTKYTGIGNTLAFTVNYEVTGKGSVQYATVSKTILECVEYKKNENTDDDDVEDEDTDPLKPYIIVDSYSYGGTSVNAGSEFTLRLTIQNTSEDFTLENIKMSLSPKGVFSMTSSSNTFYIENLYAGNKKEIEVTLYAGLSSVTDAKDANSIGIDFTFQYLNDKKRLGGESVENITIPVLYPDRFEMSQPTIPPSAYVGEEFPVYIPFVNKGRSTIYNLSAELIGANSTQGNKLYIGNVNAGTENSIEFFISPDKAEKIDGRVVITYEDANMNLKEEVVNFVVDVADMGNQEPDMPPTPPIDLPTITEPEEKDNSQRNIIYLSFGLVALMSAYITIKKTKAKRSEFTNEAL